ncbi:MAG: DUF4293 family protein [Bacteroidetes bacterium]|nr:DUF4293 family protein [Bacteroidota bacterium]
MIQRIQSVYLLVTTLLLILFIMSASAANDFMLYYPKENMLLLIMTFVIGGITLLNIFQFNNRMRQITICRFLIIAILLLMIITYLRIDKTVPNYTLLWGLYMLPAAMVSLYLAMRSIQRDEKVVRDMDRLR